MNKKKIIWRTNERKQTKAHGSRVNNTSSSSSSHHHQCVHHWKRHRNITPYKKKSKASGIASKGTSHCKEAHFARSERAPIDRPSSRPLEIHNTDESTSGKKVKRKYFEVRTLGNWKRRKNSKPTPQLRVVYTSNKKPRAKKKKNELTSPRALGPPPYAAVLPMCAEDCCTDGKGEAVWGLRAHVMPALWKKRDCVVVVYSSCCRTLLLAWVRVLFLVISVDRLGRPPKPTQQPTVGEPRVHDHFV